MGSKAKIESLQVVRAIAFIAVFLYHYIRTFPGEGVISDFFTKTPGLWGVSLFFCLSGFVMTYSYWDRAPNCSIKESALFAIKKIKRLYPLHLIMLFIGSIYLYINHETIFSIAKRLAIIIPLVNTWFPVAYRTINSVAWYLSVCLFLYFCFPLVLKKLHAQKSATRSIVVIVIVFVLQLLIGWCVFKFTSIDITWITYCHPMFRLGDFIIGGSLASIYIKCRNKQIAGWKCSILEITAIILNAVVCIVHYILPDDTLWFTNTSLFIPSSVLLVYSFSLDNGIFTRLMKNKVVFWLATISPYAFLIHRLVINYYHAFVTHVLHYDHINYYTVIIGIIVTFAITVLGTYLYMHFEKKGH